MIIIHAGFLAYEMGASRLKNALASGVKNMLAFAFMVPTFYYFGWWVYWAFPTGVTLSEGANGISGLAYANAMEILVRGKLWLLTKHRLLLLVVVQLVYY